MIVNVYEYESYRNPFIEFASYLGPIQAVAFTWEAGVVKVRYPVVIWSDFTAQHFQIEIVPSNLCRPLRKRDLKWNEFLLDENWHAERDKDIEPHVPSDTAYSQCDGRLHKVWLTHVHAERARPGADFPPLHGPTSDCSLASSDIDGLRLVSCSQTDIHTLWQPGGFLGELSGCRNFDPKYLNT